MHAVLVSNKTSASPASTLLTQTAWTCAYSVGTRLSLLHIDASVYHSTAPWETTRRRQGIYINTYVTEICICVYTSGRVSDILLCVRACVCAVLPCRVSIWRVIEFKINDILFCQHYSFRERGMCEVYNCKFNVK